MKGTLDRVRIPDNILEREVELRERIEVLERLIGAIGRGGGGGAAIIDPVGMDMHELPDIKENPQRRDPALMHELPDIKENPQALDMLNIVMHMEVFG